MYAVRLEPRIAHQHSKPEKGVAADGLEMQSSHSNRQWESSAAELLQRYLDAQPTCQDVLFRRISREFMGESGQSVR